MYKSLTTALLEHLAEHGKMAIDAFFPRNRPGTKLARELFGLDKSYRNRFVKTKKKTVSALLSRLRKDGLVQRIGSKKKAFWIITENGEQRLEEERKIFVYDLPEPDGSIRLVTFDVPEKYRKKRDWLRTQLASCGFEQLHKSVWLGKRPLPEEFINDLSEKDLTNFVHIVAVDKGGTLPRPPE